MTVLSSASPSLTCVSVSVCFLQRDTRVTGKNCFDPIYPSISRPVGAVCPCLHLYIQRVVYNFLIRRVSKKKKMPARGALELVDWKQLQNSLFLPLPLARSPRKANPHREKATLHSDPLERTSRRRALCSLSLSPF